MALEAPLRSSTGSIMSSYSPHAEMSLSATGRESPALQSQYMAYGFSHPVNPPTWWNLVD